MAKINVDVSDFLRSWAKIQQAAPERIVRGVAITAERARDAVRHRTRQVFELNSEYIIKGIRSIPDPTRAKAIASATRALTGKYRDFQAAVYLRGASDPKKSLAFMVVHETGGTRYPVSGRSLANPSRDLKGYKFKTGKGRVKKSWKPKKLLEYYNRVGAAKAGSKRQTPRRGKPKSFILKSAKGHGVMLARRKNRRTRKLEILYHFIKKADIDKRWGFVKTVKSTAHRHLTSDIVRELNRP